MIYLALTWDYELFFNRTYASDEQILIEPTAQILNLLNKHSVQSTFFIDMCMMKQYESYGNDSFVSCLENQIKDIDKSKHEVGLHLHTSWLKAEKVNDEWKFNPKYYKLSFFSEDEIREIVSYGIKRINDILIASGSGNSCTSFRAGGYCYEPEPFLSQVLVDNGVNIDSSVYRYASNRSLNQSFDYTNTPKLPYWFYSSYNRVPERTKNEIIEIPITSVRRTPIMWYLGHKNSLKRIEKRGEASVQIRNNKWKTITEKMLNRFYGAIPLSMDNQNNDLMWNVIKKYRIQDNNHNKFLVAIGHPKFQEKCTIDNLEQFISRCKDTGVIFCTLRKMRNIISESRGGENYDT